MCSHRDFLFTTIKQLVSPISGDALVCLSCRWWMWVVFQIMLVSISKYSYEISNIIRVELKRNVRKNQKPVWAKLGLMGGCDLTCMRFMASRIWSRWWAELRASRRMSVNFSSFSRSSFFSWSTISASASVHSHRLRLGWNRKERGWRGGHHDSYRSPTHTLWSYKHRFAQKS